MVDMESKFRSKIPIVGPWSFGSEDIYSKR